MSDDRLLDLPIMIVFGAEAMRAYHGYIGDLRRGRFELPGGHPR